jgi:hypothetical protein
LSRKMGKMGQFEDLLALWDEEMITTQQTVKG